MKDATAHLLSSPRNAERLRQSIDDLRALYNPILEEPIPDDMKKLLDQLS
jgi:hypothetical protein